MRQTMVLLVTLSFVYSGLAFAHGGGLTKQGCHNNRKAGVYQCHKGPLKGQNFNSKSEALAALEGQAKPRAPRPASTSLSGIPYDRTLYGGWIDWDGDCQDTRQEVLIAESLEQVKMDAGGCRVVSGKWYDPYTDFYFTDPRKLDVDHFVLLKEVHRSGGISWGSAQKKAYANDLADPKTLIAVSASANRSKGDRDPANWLPPNRAYHCEYVKAWVEIKNQWALEMDAAEAAKVSELLTGCN